MFGLVLFFTGLIIITIICCVLAIVSTKKEIQKQENFDNEENNKVNQKRLAKNYSIVGKIEEAEEEF